MKAYVIGKSLTCTVLQFQSKVKETKYDGENNPESRKQGSKSVLTWYKCECTMHGAHIKMSRINFKGSVNFS